MWMNIIKIIALDLTKILLIYTVIYVSGWLKGVLLQHVSGMLISFHHEITKLSWNTSFSVTELCILRLHVSDNKWRKISVYRMTQKASFFIKHMHFIFCSATWPPDVQRIGQSYLKDPVQVFVGSLDLAVS